MTSIKRDKSWERCYRPVILALRRLSRKKFETSPSQSKTLPQKQNKTNKTKTVAVQESVLHISILTKQYLTFSDRISEVLILLVKFCSLSSNPLK
jgi:hypothetical protein